MCSAFYCLWRRGCSFQLFLYLVEMNNETNTPTPFSDFAWFPDYTYKQHASTKLKYNNNLWKTVRDDFSRFSLLNCFLISFSFFFCTTLLRASSQTAFDSASTKMGEHHSTFLHSPAARSYDWLAPAGHCALSQGTGARAHSRRIDATLLLVQFKKAVINLQN